LKVDTARFVRSAFRHQDFLDQGVPEIAFVGRSNVGKSSLLNRLLKRKSLARISSSPGRTRAINYYLINDCFYFVDLPGYGYAKVAKKERRAWAKLTERYFREALARAKVILIVDAKVGATDLDTQAYRYLRSLGVEPTIVATKIDRVGRSRMASALQGIRQTLGNREDEIVLGFSARTGVGVKDLWREIDRYLEEATHRGSRQGMNNG
jgi:GTP-binding protein